MVLGYAAEQGWLQSNPFIGLRLSNKGKASVARKSIKRSALEKLFQLDMPAQDRLCLAILATTGMRLDEAALLEWEDIKTEGGIRYFDLSRVNKIVKNYRSEREVPVPSALQLGPAGSGRLFTYRKDLDGKAQNAASKALMRHVRKIRENSNDVRITVHSLRHTFKDLLRDAAVPVDVQEFIMGHTGSNEGSRYGSGAMRCMTDCAAEASGHLRIFQSAYAEARDVQLLRYCSVEAGHTVYRQLSAGWLCGVHPRGFLGKAG